jgi:hypothetical protein
MTNEPVNHLANLAMILGLAKPDSSICPDGQFGNNFNRLEALARMRPPEPVYVPQTEATIALCDGGFQLQDTDGKRWLYEVTEFDPVHIALIDGCFRATIGDQAAVAYPAIHEDEDYQNESHDE